MGVGEVFLPVNHRYLGNQFMMWRQEAGLSREEVAEAVGYSAEMVRSVEQGRRACPPRMAEIADELFGARGKLKAGLSYLTRDKIPNRSRDFMESEAIAISWRSLEGLLIPGLLQTEEYARTLMGGVWPPVPQEKVEERLSVRLERQKQLRTRPTVPFGFVVFEAALHVPLGGAEAQKRQLLHLAESAELPNVTFQILPYERAVPSVLSGGMVLLEMPELRRIVYVMGQSLTELVTEPKDVSHLEQKYARISAQALGPEDSVKFIERMVDRL
ncbi:helix-turn-helix domain-containing protein [Streptomyces rectiverticillatus]|nr:helix-turn-helix domain-containing protein [Streptomyces rectiverticillatus]